MKILKKKTEKLLIREFISIFESLSKKRKLERKRFSFVLTGGPSPINLYKSLSKSRVNWNNIDLFWGDERFVSQKSIYSNYRLAKKFLINNINISKKNIFFIDTKKKDVHSSSKDYEKKIKKYFKNKKISFNLVLLGMGQDGHVASVFSNDINIKKKGIISSVIRNDFKRITLNIKTINHSEKIFLWLNSKSKTKIYNKIKNNVKVPVKYLNKKKTSIFCL